MAGFHAHFYIGGGLQLIRGVFVNEGRLQFLLQVGVRGKGKTFLLLSFGIKQDEFPGNILYLLFGVGLQLLPGPRAQFIDSWCLGILSLVFGNAVQGMDVHIEHIPVLVYQLDGLLDFPVHLYFLQSAEYPDTMIHMHHIVARIQSDEFFCRDAFLAAEAIVEAELVVTFEDLVVSVPGDFQLMVQEALVDSGAERFVLKLRVNLREYVLQAFQLLFTFGKDQVNNAFPALLLHAGNQQFEILAEGRLGCCGE